MVAVLLLCNRQHKPLDLQTPAERHRQLKTMMHKDRASGQHVFDFDALGDTKLIRPLLEQIGVLSTAAMSL